MLKRSFLQPSTNVSRKIICWRRQPARRPSKMQRVSSTTRNQSYQESILKSKNHNKAHSFHPMCRKLIATAHSSTWHSLPGKTPSKKTTSVPGKKSRKFNSKLCLRDIIWAHCVLPMKVLPLNRVYWLLEDLTLSKITKFQWRKHAKISKATPSTNWAGKTVLIRIRSSQRTN